MLLLSLFFLLLQSFFTVASLIVELVVIATSSTVALVLVVIGYNLFYSCLIAVETHSRASAERSPCWSRTRISKEAVHW